MEYLSEQFITLCWAIFLIYFAASAFRVKRTVERQNGLLRVLLLAALIVVIILLKRGTALSEYAGEVLWRQTLAVRIIADLITLIGLITMLWARVVLGGNWSANVTFKENHELIERGPYAFVRHPIYSGLLLMSIGTAIMYGRVGGFIVFIIFFMSLWLKSHQEERLLTRHFPDAYPDYKARVKALIPYVF